jgi:two-component system cell cycle sensor histidine kinase/response regulator CckA
LQKSTHLSVAELPFYVASGNDEVADNLRAFIEQANAGHGGEIMFPFQSGDQNGWYRLNVRPIISWPGYTHWQLDDISKGHEDNQRLGRERVRLIEFLNHAPVGFFSVDENGVFMFANDTFINWLAAEDVDLCDGTHKLHEILIDAPKDTPAYAVSTNTGEHSVQREELRMRAFDGREFQAALSHTIVQGHDGTIRTRSIIRDLTPERAWKTALKQSEDRFQRFFEEAPLGIALIDNRGKLTECNEAFSDMAERPLHELLGMNLLEMVKPDDKGKVEAVMLRIRSGQRLESALEVELISKNNKHVVVQMFASPYMAENGVVLHFINVTERKTLKRNSRKVRRCRQSANWLAVLRMTSITF